MIIFSQKKSKKDSFIFQEIELKVTRSSKRFLRSIIDSNLFLKNDQFSSQHTMMKRLRFEEDKNIKENIIKDAGNLFRLKKLKKETNIAASKSIGSLFR